MLARVLNMRGVNLNVFQFDYDLTWAAFFLTADQHIYGRFGGRDETSPDKYLTLTGLKHAMRAALDVHRQNPAQKPAAVEPFAVEQYPAAKRLKAGACIHCHQVYDFRREDLKSQGKWSQENIWVYPLPDRLGFFLSPEVQNHVQGVRTSTPAGEAGLQAGDVLKSINGQPVVSFADVQHALHIASGDSARIAFMRGGQDRIASLKLPADWRRTDISWRESMWGLEPAVCVHGKDLSEEEKQQLGLPVKQLAFRQGKFVPAPSRSAGIREGDIILGIDDKPLELTMLRFNVFVRLNYQVGDKITFNIIRDGKKMNVPMTLPARATW